MAATSVMFTRPWKSPYRDEKAEQKDSSRSTGLSEFAARIAHDELGEDDFKRKQSLAQMREWIGQNKDLQGVRTDSAFLLRFLRIKKFSVMMAQDMLLKYLNLRQTFPRLLMNLDYIHPPVLELINKGYLVPSNVRDKYGRRVVIGNAALFDPHKYTCEDMAKVHMITYEILMEDEETQAAGVVHIGDLKTVSTSHVTLWSVSEFLTIFRWGEQSVPMRHKAIYLMNVPGALKYIYDFVRSRIRSQKIRERFHIFNSLSELHSEVDRKILPKEWGGDIPLAEMIESWKMELAAKRDTLIALDKMKLLDNSCLMKKDNNNNKNRKSNGEDMIIGSFRKLEFD